MKAQRHLWLTPRLLQERAGAAAQAKADTLGRAVHDDILATGDRLAAVSVALAQAYYRRAPMARQRFGAEGFARWVTLGEGLASVEPTTREGAVAYFSVAANRFGGEGVATAASWCRLARDVATVSRKLATIFLETTATVLARPDGLARLESWVAVGLSLYRQRGWQGEFLAQAYFGAAPRAVLMFTPELYQLWAGAGVAIQPALKEREFFGNLPRELHAWHEAERAMFLRATLALATAAPKHAATFYRELPGALRRLPPDHRAALLRVLARAVKPPSAVADLAPVAGAVLMQVPLAQREEALALVEQVAGGDAEVAVASLRSLARVYEEADPAQVRAWFAAGRTLGSDNAAARLAFFALESRTSIKVLHTGSTAVALEEAQGVLRKYLQMLSGEPVSIGSVSAVRLTPPLEEFPAENEVTLPLRIDWLGMYEDNFRLYRFLAAQVAGRRELGTYEFVTPDGDHDADAPWGSALRRYLEREGHPDLLEDLFVLAEGIRIHAGLCVEYGGMAREGRWVGAQVLRRLGRAAGGGREQVIDALFALFLADDDAPALPEWLPVEAAAIVASLTAPLRRPTATVGEAMQVAHALAARLAATAPARARELDGDALMLERIAGDALLDPYLDDDGQPAFGEARRVPGGPRNDDEVPPPNENKFALSEEPDDDIGGGTQPMSVDELKRLLEAGVNLTITQAAGEEADGLGLYITDLLGKIPSQQIEVLRRLLGSGDEKPGRSVRRWLGQSTSSPSFYYDEWDYHIGDYRSRWCRLQEITLDADSGEFYNQALVDYARLIPEVRRQFQRVRPEMYRTVRGLEDGEDFDLNAVINAVVEARAGRAPSPKLYVARKREERDVATLFLLDMSASTDEPLAPSVDADRTPRADTGRVPTRARRIIDVTKAALVIMAAALEEIGDTFAIYGFSGHGREQVEFYRVKSFADPLNPTVKGRMGGIEPKRSTRMGTALRHATEKMAAVSCRSKHLFLLSDGFPQDYDYGQDRRSNVYGIRDTAVALREAEAMGITPFCITVDKAGHDYLRQMCDESRYMVIEDIEALPRELPKVYQRVVRG